MQLLKFTKECFHHVEKYTHACSIQVFDSSKVNFTFFGYNYLTSGNKKRSSTSDDLGFYRHINFQNEEVFLTGRHSLKFILL